MLFQKMTEKYHKEMRRYGWIFLALFFLTLVMALLEVGFELAVFNILFQIGKYICIVFAVVIVFRVGVLCEKAMKQHDELVDKLAEMGR